jgi:hypothetical protein
MLENVSAPQNPLKPGSININTTIVLRPTGYLSVRVNNKCEKKIPR